jgi:hypothetical protein
MATSFTFNNEVVRLPGSYSQFSSGVTNPPLSLSFGNILLIDTGSGAGYGAGAGVAGELSSDMDAVYTVDNLRDFRSAVGGGILWDIAANLFQPNGAGGGNGVSKIFYVRAATTLAASATLVLTGGGSNGGSITIKAKNEGVVGNGSLYGVKIADTSANPAIVTALGLNTDVHSLTVNDPSLGIITIGTHTVSDDSTETVSTVAQSLVDNINLDSNGYGYEASINGSSVIVKAKSPVGNESATEWDSLALTYVATAVAGSPAGTDGSFAGAVDGTTLVLGYGIEMLAGSDDTSKFIVKISRGGFKGLDANGYLWDEISEKDSKPSVIATSPEFDNISELISWMTSNTTFGSSFSVTASTVNGDGSVDSADLAANANFNLFAGGNEVYGTNLVDDVLDYVQGFDYSIVLSDEYAENAQGVNNAKILASIADADTFGDKIMVIGGGADQNAFPLGTLNSSIDTAQYYNNDRVIVAHGAPIKNTLLVADGFVDKTPLHKAASVCGRMAGLEPQIPITFKTLQIDGEKHKLSIKEKKQGLKYGVLMTEADGSFFRVLQGVNTIQDNDYLINPNGSTHSVQLRRMLAQVNRELVVNATEQLLKNPDGTNRNTLSRAAVKAFTETYLKGRTATTTSDNMILSFKNVVVELDNDAYKVSYDVIFNTEITKLFFTGTIFLNF